MNNLRGQAKEAGLENAFDFGFVPAYIRDLFCEGKGPLDGYYPVMKMIFLGQMKRF